MTKLIRASADTVAAIVEKHRDWLVSNGVMGERADLSMTDLRDAGLNGVDLRQANLRGADLRNMDLWDIKLQGANLSRANLEGAILIGASLDNADLTDACLKGTRLMEASFRKANLWGADLHYADLMRADLRGAVVSKIGYNRWGSYYGVKTEGCVGNPMFHRFAQDQAFLEELKNRGIWGKFLYSLWSVLADCGRTPWRWLAWSVILCGWFALIFYGMGPGSFRFTEGEAGALSVFSPESMAYYSAAAFLGRGAAHIQPVTESAVWWTVAETAAGYIMLAGLIAIMVNFLARRS